LPSNELIPPPNPEPPATKKGTEIPPLSSSGPSAPLPASPAPGALPPLGKEGAPPVVPPK
jgi:hypothetical protein